MILVIGKVDVGKYIQQSGISESYSKVYDIANQFTAADGTEIKRCLGAQKSYDISLGNVPVNVKNQLRSRSRYGYIECTVGEETASYMINNFSADIVVKYGDSELWSVRFTLSAKDLIPGSSSQTGIYAVKCDGISFSMAKNEFIGDIKISNNTGGLPVSGIAASQLSFSLDLEKMGVVIEFDPAGECNVIGMSTPTYYITGRNISGNEYNITATDRTIFLDLPFDYTTLEQFKDDDNNVPVSNVIGEIARKAGFKSSGSGAITSVIDKIPVADLATSCRSILDMLSQIACGVWYCDASDSLQFVQFGSSNSMFSPSDYERTDIMNGMKKGPISGVLMVNNSTNTDTSEIFSEGSTSSTFHAIKITSKYATAERCRAVYDGVKNHTYKAFSVSKCECSYYLPVCTSFSDEHGNSYLATNITINLSRTGGYASIGADMYSETEWDFNGALLKLGNKYPCYRRKER